MRIAAAFATVLLLASALPAEEKPSAPGISDTPETVMATFRAKPGKEAALREVIERHWATVRKLGLAAGDLHLLFRTEDEPGKTMFLHVFTWKSHAIPDAAPPEIERIWEEMKPLVETRGGHRGIEIPEITPLPLPGA